MSCGYLDLELVIADFLEEALQFGHLFRVLGSEVVGFPKVFLKIVELDFRKGLENNAFNL